MVLTSGDMPGPADDLEERRGLRVRAYVWWLTAISVLAFGIRIEYVAARWDNLVSLAADQFWYQNLAGMIMSGRGISSPTAWALDHQLTPTALHGPFTSFLLVPFNLVGYSTLHEHQILMVLLGTITVVMLAVLSGRLMGRGAGVVTGFVGAVYPGLWAFDAKVMSEPVEQFLVAVLLLLSYSFRYRPTTARALGIGLVVGLSALTRSELLLEIPLIVVPLCVGALRRQHARYVLKVTGVALGTTVVVLAPWIGYCHTVFHDPEILSTDLGVGLIQDNNPTTYYTSRIGYWWAAAEEPEPGDESQRDHDYEHQAADYARANDGRLPEVILARVGRLWDLYDPFQTASFTAPTPACQGELGCTVYTVEDLKTQDAWIWSFYVLVPFAIVGLVVLKRRKKILYPLLSLAVIVTVVAIVEAGVLRFRAGFEDAFVVLAGIGLYSVLQRARATGPLVLTAKTPMASR